MKPVSMARHILLLLALFKAGCFDASAVKSDVFSSPSTLRRVTEMEDSKDFKDFKKNIKKRYSQIKDVAVEEWKDGETYYVLYCKDFSNKGLCLMRLTDSIPMFSLPDRIYSFPALELSSIDGHTVFRVDDSKYLFHNGEICSFNPKTDLRDLGDRRYVVIDDKQINIYNIYSLDGTHLLMAESFEFRDATPAGITHDEATGLSIYHPALPPRFFGQDKTEYMRNVGRPITYKLGYYKSPNWKFNIQVPGGEYYIDRLGGAEKDVKTEIRSDQYGNMHEYKVFEVGKIRKKTECWPTSLCRHNGTTGEPIIRAISPR